MAKNFWAVVFLGALVATPAFAADEVPSSIVEKDRYLYRGATFEFVVPNPDGRLEFYVRRLVESGEQKVPFGRWAGRGEFARVVDPRGATNISFLILRKDTPEIAMANLLKGYTEDLVYFERGRVRSEITLPSGLSTKEVTDLNINRHWRRVAFGWTRLTSNPHPILFVWVWNRGVYDDKVDEVLVGIMTSIRLQPAQPPSGEGAKTSQAPQ